MRAAYISAWKRLSDYSGRSTRSDFWLFFVMNYVFVFLGFGVVGAFMPAVLMLGILYGLASFVPLAALAFRRLRDAALSPWLALLPFGPILFSIALEQLVSEIVGLAVFAVGLVLLLVLMSLPTRETESTEAADESDRVD